MAKKVLIFTKKVLPLSNTFVASQALNLPSIEPVFIGFSKDKTGLSLIQGKNFFVLNDYQPLLFLARLALEKFSYVGKRWVELLKTQQPIVLHAHFGKGGFYCAPFAKRLNIPLITTFHGSDITQDDKFSYNQAHRQIVFQRSTKIIAVSKFVEKKLIEKGCLKEKIIQVYTGIDCEFFSAKQVKPSVPTVLFVGRLIKQKGCNYLLKAMKDITLKHPQVQVVIAGDGIERKALEAMASIQTNIKFVGAQTTEQIKDLMAKAWILCAPSIRMKRGNEEGLGMVFLESQAMGTPVISFDTGGVSEAVVDGKTGFLVDEKDTSALIKKIELLLTNTELRNQFSISAVEHIHKNFNIKQQSKKIENIYLQTIQRV